MRRPRTSSPIETNLLALAEPDRRRRVRRLISRAVLAVRCLAIPAALIGFTVHIASLEIVSVTILMQAAFSGESEAETTPDPAALAGPARTDPPPSASSAAAAPAALVFRPKLAGPNLEPMYVEAKHGQSADPWYNGGGIGLTRSGLIFANNGRMQAKSWETRPGAVLRDVTDDTTRDSTPDWTSADAATDRVAELAVICHRGFVRRVYLRDENGLILASLPVAGLDGARLSALTRAAGIHYGRYHVSRSAGLAQVPDRMDCFPRAKSCVHFNGPETVVPEPIWTGGEGESADR